MNFAERLVAGPPVLRTVSRKPVVGDLVYVAPDGEIFEITQVLPAVVPTVKYPSLNPVIGFKARTVEHATSHVEVGLTHREPVVLTKAEAKAAKAHYADLAVNR